MNDMINERDKEFANEFSRFVNGSVFRIQGGCRVCQ